MTEQTPNPAIVPEPEAQQPHTYKVTGTLPVLGHQPGDQFTALLNPVQERLLVEGGALSILDDPDAVEISEPELPGADRAPVQIPDDLNDLHRDELDALAARVGVKDPHKLHDKAAVIAALGKHTPSTAPTSAADTTPTDKD